MVFEDLCGEISIFIRTRQTDRLTDGQNRLLHACVRGNDTTCGILHLMEAEGVAFSVFLNGSIVDSTFVAHVHVLRLHSGVMIQAISGLHNAYTY